MTGCKYDIFKRCLDNYLSTITDEPQVLGCTAQRRADSNSILDMSKLLNATGHRKWKCMATQIHPAEQVALAALPGYSVARGYYRVTRYAE